MIKGKASRGFQLLTGRQYRPQLHSSSRNLPLLWTDSRLFHASRGVLAIKPFILADIGEGIRECEIIQWFVEPGAHVEQFSKLCEVQSDKASVEITSRFDGVIKKLHYEAGDMAIVGKPLIDIDVDDEIAAEVAADAEAAQTPSAEQAGEQSSPGQPARVAEQQSSTTTESGPLYKDTTTTPAASGSQSTLATPAVRHLTKEHGVSLADVRGTGKDGRVLKEDVLRFINQRANSPDVTSSEPPPSCPDLDAAQKEEVRPLTPVKAQMFKTMTRSLQIPHFLYADELRLDALSALRARLNTHSSTSTRLSYLPFIIKAVSLSLADFPLLNARVDHDPGTAGARPNLVMRALHNIGVAMDTPQGLLVPNIKNVGAHSVASIAGELARLQALASEGKLPPADLTGGTITVSNIGNIGGTYVAPVLVSSEVAILGIGRKRTVPAFDDDGELVRREVMNFSWSADHRVVDGATMARMAEKVREYVEAPELMLARLR